MIVGALCHDIDHPGLNNDFLVKQAIAAYAASPPCATQLAEDGLGADSRRRWWCFQKHPVAITYNDHSVLENRHVAILYSILLKQESDVFSSLDRCGRGGMEWRRRRARVHCCARPDAMRSARCCCVQLGLDFRAQNDHRGDPCDGQPVRAADWAGRARSRLSA